MEDLPPYDVGPYETLQIDRTATLADIKKSYRKLALQHHPDKVKPSQREEAHAAFQKLAFAYALLSDQRRRKRYDTTGNTSESLDAADGEFDWVDFFRAQWKDTVTSQALNDFKSKYHQSDEEAQDVLEAYRKSQGDMDGILERVMLSNAMDDEARFRQIIDAAIEDGSVPSFDKYTHEPASKKTKRLKKAKKEAEEAEEHLRKMKEESGKDQAQEVSDTRLDSLAAIIQQRQQTRARTFLDDLEAKYAAPEKTKKKKTGQTKVSKLKRKPDKSDDSTATATPQSGKRRKAAA